MQHIFQRRGGVIVQKILLIMVSCLVVCGFAYRWGDAKWEDAKITAVEKLYISISEVMFPQIYVYEYDKKTLIYQDMEQVFMPVVSSFRSSGTRTSSGQDLSNVGQDATMQQMPDSSQAEEEIKKEDDVIEYIEQNDNLTEDAAMEQMEEVDAKPEDGMLQKKVEINRIKLQDFDYLRQNFYQVDNTTTVGSDLLDVTQLLGKDMTIKEQSDGPQILIYHTHSQEAYKDSTPGDPAMTVVGVGDYLEQLLEQKYGIEVLHHKGVYDLPRDSAYSAALPNIEKVLQENPTIEVVIDLHRDGVAENRHLVTEVNGKQTAKLMFFNGLCKTTAQGELTYLPNPYIEDNLALSFQMQLAAEEYYPGLMRKIYLKGYRYNLHLKPKSMLVEVGAQTNTFEEAKNAMEPLANILAMVLLENDSTNESK